MQFRTLSPFKESENHMPAPVSVPDKAHKTPDGREEKARVLHKVAKAKYPAPPQPTKS